MYSNRAGGTEQIDEMEATPAFARASYRAMEGVNRHLGGTRVVRQFIERELRDFDQDRPLRALDLGSGACDIPIAIARWAREHGYGVEFTCLEPNPHGRAMARAKLREHPYLPVEVREDRFEEYSPDTPYDCAVGSMFFHHFTDRQILDMLRRLRGFVRRSVLINDLHRTPVAFLGFMVLSFAAARAVTRDGLHSIRRGFRLSALKSTLEQVPDAEVRIRWAYLFRVAAEVRFA